MPVIRIELLSGRTRTQKSRLAKVVTEAVCTIALCQPQDVQIVFVDVERGDWAVAGALIDEGAARPVPKPRRAPRRRAAPRRRPRP